MKKPKPPEMLIVDDEKPVLHALSRVVHRQFGSAVELACTTLPDQALRWAAERPFAVVVSDLRMPAHDGLRLLQEVAALQPHAVRLLLTGAADFASAQRAVNQVGVFRYLTKPWDDHELAAHLRAALLEHSELRRRVCQAEAWARSSGQLSPQEAERHRLESMEPGITRVEWGPLGEVLMPPLEGDTVAGSLALQPPHKPPTPDDRQAGPGDGRPHHALSR